MLPVKEQEAFLAMLRENPNATLQQFGSLWQERISIHLSRSTVHDYIRRMGDALKDLDCQ